MSEWPKILYADVDDHQGEGWSTFEQSFKVPSVEVIPAGLGRELYEALAQIKRLVEASESSPDMPLPKSTLFQVGLETEAPLARYEREVGQGGRDHEEPIGPTAPIRGPGAKNVGVTPRGTIEKLDAGAPASYEREVGS